MLRYLIKHNELKQVLVFTSSVYEADKVTDKLRKNGIDAAAMHSKKSQGARTDALSRFKSGKLPVLVATDLISRGIDIKESFFLAGLTVTIICHSRRRSSFPCYSKENG